MLCHDCPRNCGIDRALAVGYCHAGPVSRVARVMLHQWEEPCISGTRGSGAVFFSGCNLRCVFCQNYLLLDGALGETMDANALYACFLSLQEQGAHNVNLVTAAPHLACVVPALEKARASGLTIPVVYNSGGYESVASLKRLEGLVDIYLPDFKYVSPIFSARFSNADDYAAYALPAVCEMFRQVGGLQTDADGLARRGLIVRHLILPGCVNDSRAVLDTLAAHLPLDTQLSLMRQYTPTPNTDFAPLNRPLTNREYDRIISYALSIGFHNIWIQARSSVNPDFTPTFTKSQ